MNVDTIINLISCIASVVFGSLFIITCNYIRLLFVKYLL